MSYRVWSYHKACLSLVRHGWLVVLLLGRRISSAKAISPLISRCALETSGDSISIDEAGSGSCYSLISILVEDYFSDLCFPCGRIFRSRQKLCCVYMSVCVCVECVWVSATQSDVGMAMSPLHCWNRLRANQSSLDLNIPTARPMACRRRRPLPWCQTRQSKHVAVSRKCLKEKSIRCY